MGRGEDWGRGVAGAGSGWEQGPGCTPMGGLRSPRPSKTMGCSQEGPWQEPSLDPSLSTTTPRGQVSGFCHCCLAGSHVPAGLGHGSILLSQLLFPLHLRWCQAHPTARHQHCLHKASGKSRVQGTRHAASPAVRARPQSRELGHSCDMGLRPTGRDMKPAEWQALGTADSSREGRSWARQGEPVPISGCHLNGHRTQESSGAFGQSCGAFFVRAGELNWL